MMNNNQRLQPIAALHGLGDLAAWTGLGLPVLTVILYSMRKSPTKRANAQATA